MLVVGATAVIQLRPDARRGRPSPWLLALVNRKPPKLACRGALANKTARIAWKLIGQRPTMQPAAGAKPLRSPNGRHSAVLAASRPLRADFAVA